MFHLSKKNKAVIATLSLLLVFMSCGWYVWSCYHMTQERWMRAKATVDVCCHYELRAGNKILLDLGNDTTKLDAFFINQSIRLATFLQGTFTCRGQCGYKI